MVGRRRMRRERGRSGLETLWYRSQPRVPSFLLHFLERNAVAREKWLGLLSRIIYHFKFELFWSHNLPERKRIQRIKDQREIGGVGRLPRRCFSLSAPSHLFDLKRGDAFESPKEKASTLQHWGKANCIGVWMSTSQICWASDDLGILGRPEILHFYKAPRWCYCCWWRTSLWVARVFWTNGDLELCDA